MTLTTSQVQAARASITNGLVYSVMYRDAIKPETLANLDDMPADKPFALLVSFAMGKNEIVRGWYATERAAMAAMRRRVDGKPIR